MQWGIFMFKIVLLLVFFNTKMAFGLNNWPKTKLTYELFDSKKAFRKGQFIGLNKNLLDLIRIKKKNNIDKSISKAITFRQLIEDIKNNNLNNIKEYLVDLNNSNFLKSQYSVDLIYKNWPRDKIDILIELLNNNGYFDLRIKSQCPFYELNLRNDRSKALIKILKEEGLKRDLKEKILHELLVFLPDTFDKASKEDIKGLNFEDLSKRLENLLIFGKNSQAIKTYEDYIDENKGIAPLKKCELTYFKAKALRHLKKYQSAKRDFDYLSENCSESLMMKSRFMSLSISMALNERDSLDRFDQFVKDYPTSSLSDDILIYKESILKNFSQVEEQKKVLQRVIDEYPDQDMVGMALFSLSFIYAKENNLDLALKYLERQKKLGNKDEIKALYWQNRLSIFKNPNSMKDIEKKNFKSAVLGLKKIHETHPESLYGILSYNLLKSLNIRVNNKYFFNKKPIKIDLLSLPSNLKEIGLLILNGFRDEALLLLDGIFMDEENKSKGDILALFYYILNRPEKALQKSIKCSENSKQKLSKEYPFEFNLMYFPECYKEEITKASTKYNISPNLFMGLLRRESVFMPKAQSWAGAMGLGQLMPTTAFGQAKKIGLSNFKEEDLYDVEINLAISSSLLSHLLKKYGHVVYALAAYNAGEGQVNNWIKKNPDLPIDTFIESIPIKETREYIEDILESFFQYQFRKDKAHLFFLLKPNA